ncbi:MAG: hypothetical protein HYY14_02500 [Candidatus Omnitrophica bacterium]|nr:hypothetical protein [Candidatus Omnitrophota bacterium]
MDHLETEVLDRGGFMSLAQFRNQIRQEEIELVRRELLNAAYETRGALSLKKTGALLEESGREQLHSALVIEEQILEGRQVAAGASAGAQVAVEIPQPVEQNVGITTQEVAVKKELSLEEIRLMLKEFSKENTLFQDHAPQKRIRPTGEDSMVDVERDAHTGEIVGVTEIVKDAAGKAIIERSVNGIARREGTSDVLAFNVVVKNIADAGRRTIEYAIDEIRYGEGGFITAYALTMREQYPWRPADEWTVRPKMHLYDIERDKDGGIEGYFMKQTEENTLSKNTSNWHRTEWLYRVEKDKIEVTADREYFIARPGRHAIRRAEVEVGEGNSIRLLRDRAEIYDKSTGQSRPYQPANVVKLHELLVNSQIRMIVTGMNEARGLAHDRTAQSINKATPIVEKRIVTQQAAPSARDDSPSAGASKANRTARGGVTGAIEEIQRLAKSQTETQKAALETAAPADSLSASQKVSDAVLLERVGVKGEGQEGEVVVLNGAPGVSGGVEFTGSSLEPVLPEAGGEIGTSMEGGMSRLGAQGAGENTGVIEVEGIFIQVVSKEDEGAEKAKDIYELIHMTPELFLDPRVKFGLTLVNGDPQGAAQKLWSQLRLGAFSKVNIEQLKSAFDRIHEVREGAVKAFYEETRLYYDRVLEELKAHPELVKQDLTTLGVEELNLDDAQGLDAVGRRSLDEIVGLVHGHLDGAQDNISRNFLALETSLRETILVAAVERLKQRLSEGVHELTGEVRALLEKSGADLIDSGHEIQAMIVLPQKG